MRCDGGDTKLLGESAYFQGTGNAGGTSGRRNESNSVCLGLRRHRHSFHRRKPRRPSCRSRKLRAQLPLPSTLKRRLLTGCERVFPFDRAARIGGRAFRVFQKGVCLPRTSPPVPDLLLEVCTALCSPHCALSIPSRACPNSPLSPDFLRAGQSAGCRRSLTHSTKYLSSSTKGSRSPTSMVSEFPPVSNRVEAVHLPIGIPAYRRRKRR